MRKIKVKFIDWWTPNVENHVLVHALKENFDVEFSDDADYVFYSVMGHEHLDLPHKCIKIYYTGENVPPDFNLCDYAFAFDWIEYGDRYMRLPDYYNVSYKEDVELASRKHEIAKTINLEKDKTDFCSMVVSRGNFAAEIREKVFYVLGQYKRVDSGGKFLNNVGGPVPNKRAFDQTHKFSIAFENTSTRGYTTEKIVNAFAACTVPIYWGDPEVTKVFNPKAFINVLDYMPQDYSIPESERIDIALKRVLEKVKELDADDEAYMRMLQEPAFVSEEFYFDNQYRKLCDFLKHIVDQPLEAARRQDYTCYGVFYREGLRMWKYKFERSISGQIWDSFKYNIKKILRK